MNNDHSAKDFEQSMFDCLHYYVKKITISNSFQYDINKYDLAPYLLSYQVIPYCFRPLGKSENASLDFYHTLSTNFTFEQLRTLNVTSEQLYLWSAPIDIVEEYEIYLSRNDTSFKTLFYNCTPGWFGSLCQYSFGLKNKSLPFNDIVKWTFEQKERYHRQMLEPSMIFSNLSCYMHLKCNRGGPFPACLDWREICDGKVDCIDEGLDEQVCDQLEINECNENEYRCHNGQCISEEFLWDISNNLECLDGTDEVTDYDDIDLCPYDPSFRCEDRMWRPRSTMQDMDVVCGDGSYKAYTNICVNKRHLLMKKAMIQSTVNISIVCRDAMACHTGLDDCITDTNITNHCPELFPFPGVPVLFGHVQLLYKNNLSDVSSSRGILLPTYVCYESSLCPLPSIANVTNHSACLPIELLSNFFTTDYFSSSWDVLIREIKDIFYGCAIVSGGYCQHNHTLYTCNFTKKCISKHRLLDGVADCLLKDDEDFGESCTLNYSKHRLTCDNRCISPLMINDGRPSCSQKEDEQSPYSMDVKNKIYFQIICDGHVELVPLTINKQNYTDESECDLWPCSNSYTRCNGIWNCPNGADEMNCPSSTCPLLQKICFIVPPPHKFLSCKTIDKAMNTSVDCFDGLNERELCHKIDYYFTSSDIFSINNDEIRQTDDLCFKKPKCIHQNDEQFCTSVLSMCILDYESFQKDKYTFRCEHDYSHKLKFIPFSLKNSRIYPINFQNSNMTVAQVPIKQKFILSKNIQSKRDVADLALIWRCNRGLNIRVPLGDNRYYQGCLCPPSYYGDLCQYQNQRVSLTFQVRVSLNWRTMIAIIFTLVDNDEQIINSHDQIQYLPIRDCIRKFNIYLLYSTRPKSNLKNYSVRIDVFNKHSLEYRASWLYPILFPFLPVNRMALQITVPIGPVICHRNCGTNGQCSKYENTETYFCRCNHRWSGPQCNIQHACNCSSDALCIGPSICLCPLEKFGPRCYLKRNRCQFDSCMNDGTCISSDVLVSEDHISCICREGFSGEKCQFIDSRIDFKFRGVTIPNFIFIHFITVFDNIITRLHTRTTTFKKIGIYDDTIVIFRTVPFRIVFIEMYKNYYLIVLQENYIPSNKISTDVIPSHRCLSINELFNATFVELHLIRRIKHYHIPCQKQPHLACFFDDTQMCLCNSMQQANCFDFDHNMTHNCRGVNYCKNGGQCFQDDPRCPTTSACYCLDCYYGSRCQLSSKGFSLSLDIILGYHILPNIKLTQQPLVTQVSAIITMVIVLTGLVSSLLSMITFRDKKARDNGCGIYIFLSSLTSLLTMIMLTFKFWYLVVSQMTLITNRSLLQFNCISIDFLLRVFLMTTDWLNACVTVERAITVAKELRFDKLKSRRVAKWIIICIAFVVILTSIHDPIHRHLVDDEDEQRIWCETKYSSFMHIFNSTIVLFHSLLPFAINVLSAVIIILLAARKRSEAHIEKPSDENLLEQYREQLRKQYREQLRKQFKEHKHILISSCILVILALPRLIISFLSGCMKSAREPWLFLIGYFLSFIPSALIFVIFILPSTVYKKQLKNGVLRIRRKFHYI